MPSTRKTARQAATNRRSARWRPGAYYINLRDPPAEWPVHAADADLLTKASRATTGKFPSRKSRQVCRSSGALMGFFNQFTKRLGPLRRTAGGRDGVQRTIRSAFGYSVTAWRICASRLVCDTGSIPRWTREQAINRWSDVTGDQLSSTTTEIERYCVRGRGRRAATWLAVRRSTACAMRARRRCKSSTWGFHDVADQRRAAAQWRKSLVQQWTATVSGPARTVLERGTAGGGVSDHAAAFVCVPLDGTPGQPEIAHAFRQHRSASVDASDDR